MSVTAERPVALPELAVEPHVLVLPVPNDGDVDRFVAEWLAAAPELGPHRGELEPVVAAACTESQQGEVAVFLSYRPRGADLVGGAALLTLELLDPMTGTAGERAERLAAELRGCADRLGHTDGLAEVGARRTVAGVAAVRLRFLAVAGAWPDRIEVPVVEACRWFYPVPQHPDLAWSLLFQTTDLAAADELLGDFDRLAQSLTWAVEDETDAAPMPGEGPATGYCCALPGGWVFLDGEAERTAASVRRAVRQRVRRDRRLTPYIAHLDRLLTHECAVASARGARWVSLLAEPCEDRVLTAAATFTIANLDPGGPPDGGFPPRRRPREPAVDDLLRQVAPEHERAAADDPAASLTVVRLPQQRGLVRRWRQVGPYGGQSQVTHHLWQLLLPWPGRPAAGVLTFSTPSEALREGIQELFDTCCSSFRWSWEPPPHRPGPQSRAGPGPSD